MTAPALELQGAIVAALKADAGVDALIGDRIYDRVPVNASFPYVSWGIPDQVDDSNDCSDIVEVNVTLHVWSRDYGTVQATRVAAAIRDAIHDAALSLTDNALIYIVYRNTAPGPSDDGLTTHLMVMFRAEVQTP